MNLRYISKHEESKKDKIEERKLMDLRSFARKELFALSQKHLSVPIFVMKL